MFFKLKKELGFLPTKDEIILEVAKKKKNDEQRHKKNMQQLYDMLTSDIRQNLYSNIFWDRDTFKINLDDWAKVNQVKDFYKDDMLNEVTERIVSLMKKLGYYAIFDNRVLEISIKDKETQAQL